MFSQKGGEGFWSKLTGGGKNPKVVLAQKKKAYLENANQETLHQHPEEAPYSLRCPISQLLITEPVITSDGLVYDKAHILREIDIRGRDPQTRVALTKEQIYAFPELNEALSRFSKRQKIYQARKTALLEGAFEIAHGEVYTDNPPEFICPISQEIMEVPVITAQGKLYDRDALQQYLKEHNNVDETGARLEPDDYQPFPEFREQINVFLFKQDAQRNGRSL